MLSGSWHQTIACLQIYYEKLVGTYLPITLPIARSNATNGSADFKKVLKVKLLTALRHCPSWYDALGKHYFWHCTYSEIVLWQIQLEAHNWKAVIWSAQWSANEQIDYVRDISLHKIESVTSNVSGAAHQLLTTWQIIKIKSITPMSISRRDRLQPLRVMTITSTNKD